MRARAARRRRRNGGRVYALTPLGTLRYRADVGDGLIEHELVHLHCGVYEGPVSPDSREAELYAWKTLAEIEADAATSPERFTAWFCLYVQKRWPLQIRGRE